MNVSLGQGEYASVRGFTSLPNQMLGGFVVFVADEFEQLGICRQTQVHSHGPGPAVGRGIVDGNADVHVAEVPALETFDDSQLVADRVTEIVEPGLTVESDGFDDERVAFPL